jgi:hypothetical protein
MGVEELKYDRAVEGGWGVRKVLETLPEDRETPPALILGLLQ